MSSNKSNLTTLSEFKDKHYGPRGTANRKALEAGFERFKKANATTLIGAYRSDESADDILEEIRSSRVSARRDEFLDS